MKVKRYRPAFFEGFESKNDVKEFTTKDELLSISWIRRWKTKPMQGDQFSGFYISDDHLVAVYNYNTPSYPIWWVVAIFPDDKETLDVVSSWFPKWGDPEYVMLNGDVIDVQSWCGDKITYKKNGSDEEFSGTETWLKQNMKMNRFPRITFK